jgi:hypothetical protein
MDEHSQQVEAAKQWLRDNMPKNLEEFRANRNEMILALNRQGFTQDVIAEAVECSQPTVARTLIHYESKGEEIHKDPRGGARSKNVPDLDDEEVQGHRARMDSAEEEIQGERRDFNTIAYHKVLGEVAGAFQQVQDARDQAQGVDFTIRQRELMAAKVEELIEEANLLVASVQPNQFNRRRAERKTS